MAVPSEHAADEIKSLQRCINDLVTVLALPAMWTGGDPSLIVNTLLDFLISMLQLDFVFARLRDPAGDAMIEMLRVTPSPELSAPPQGLRALLHDLHRDDPQNWPAVVRGPAGEGDIFLFALRLGVHDEAGLIVAGSRRADFPRRTERLLLSVAVNQAAIGLHEARLLGEQKRAAAALDLRRMTETIPEMLWSATAEGAIDYCNARVLDYTGLSAEAVMGNGWMELLHPDDVDQTLRVWNACVASGAPYRVEVRTFHAADRTYRWCVTTALPLLDSQGRILKWYGTIVDMHDWKQAQDELRNTQAALAHVTRVMTMGELTASIAHEINQPLAGIITNASTCLRMLAADHPNVDGARETARRTIRDANRASQVIIRLRALFAKQDIAAEPVDVNEAAREVIALCSSDQQRNGVLLRLELAGDLPTVMGDRIQLQQVILNLLTNASDAMIGVDDRPRELLIKTQLDEAGHVCVTVRDSGVGFNPRDADKLFATFYTTKHAGMGIGLSVSRSIIESHHGRMWAAVNDGPGATFSFSIPRGPEDPARVNDLSTARSKSWGHAY